MTIVQKMFASALVAVGLGLIVTAAEADVACAPRDLVLKALGEKLQQVPVAMGLDRGGTVLEVLASADGETWTLIVTQPSGVSCVGATGTHWELVEVRLGIEH